MIVFWQGTSAVLKKRIGANAVNFGWPTADDAGS